MHVVCMHWIPAVPHYFKIWYDDREYEQQDLQSSENQNITFLTLRSQNGVESKSATLSYKRLKQTV